ncbi:MAG: hypothetical protein AUH72_17610 [Acidobacteria bacterium 13_1_40CM_4_65_8]|nr:MAG: hypothetical protein AUH72_17610 [Acidobacteria bacterium 13_1_40CM_4_65_8]
MTFSVGGSAFSAGAPVRRHAMARVTGRTKAITSESRLVIYGISQPLTNSSSISAWRAAASRRPGPVGVEQFQNASFAGVVTDLGDAFDLASGVHRGSPVAVRVVTPFDHRGAQGSDLGSKGKPECFGARLGLIRACFGERAFGTTAIEERHRGVHGDDAADVTTARC